ncbi:type VI secretion system baseplate subunit TssF [Myxococcus llanfairpwllgwyngyllgogerychwyrndrobwllllantysiliogogogochensis]|uniref:Type VI secretion system baseplate subunit TssF n=1 Tax=Myxococcus llanfairpwllgwyngyllgogerychwyrndrobwllllantysiliogogogochensis TaxID=2590453 RepID=A0A540WN76_9BACT|nr:type VI secretion system baseplate subunit TssF [Myxococcus llanfairpwllgwyngyllgogerychwyrndrobwllllantysiliogogogochensis]TQF10297.1 type VI secretion system baseplate subunit TssF [Myxococcus llanfairpwllgwyngyllgogerychwyrndrobwllllantysiliogogogochensis]
MFSKYYLSELTYLREMGRAFGLANPSLAGLLVERGADPDVERLLEGFAFLTARIRERVDDDVPELVHGLTELLLPHYLRPLPAASIVEFSPHLRALRGRSRLAAGAEVASQPIDGTRCVFRTTTDVDLLPVQLTDAMLDRSSITSPVLRLSFQTTEQGRAEVFRQQGLRLFIHGELSASAVVLLCLLRYCGQVRVRGASSQGDGIKLPAGSLQAVGFQRDFRLLPWPRASEGYRLLQEYLTLPEKFLFFDVKNLDAAAMSVREDRFEIAFHLERPPPLDARIHREMFRLHCAPVVNLFSAPANPVLHHALDREHLLRAADLPPNHAEVYSVDSVTGLQSGRNERRGYRPFFEFSHTAGGDAEQSFYRLRRMHSPLDEGIDMYITLETPRDVAPVLGAEEALSIDLTCTNRTLPSRLQVGDLTESTSASPTQAKFKNISPVSRPARAPLGAELHWRLLSHLAINQHSLADAAALRRLMDLYNFHSLTDNLAARASRLRINAIRAVETKPVTRFLEGAPLRGHRTRVDLDEENFMGVGDSFLFGCVLEELLASHVTINSFNELSIRLHPSQTEYMWLPRNGSQTLL